MDLPTFDFLDIAELAKRWGCTYEVIVRYIETDKLHAAFYYHGGITARPRLDSTPARTVDDSVDVIIRALITLPLILKASFDPSDILIRYESAAQRWSDPAARKRHNLSASGYAQIEKEVWIHSSDWSFDLHCPPWDFMRDYTRVPEMVEYTEWWVVPKQEIERFEQKYGLAEEITTASTTAAAAWPWGSHETELLRKMSAAASRFWRNYDPTDYTTAPKNADVAEWLQSQGVAERVSAIMAQILRADGLPPGPRK